MKKVKTIFAFTLLIGFIPSLADAAIVYDNGGPTTTNSYSIWNDRVTQDDFTLGVNASISGIGFYFQNSEGTSGWNSEVEYRIYSDASGMPDALLASGNGDGAIVAVVDSGQPWCCDQGSAFPNAYLVEFELESDFNAFAGITYWLALTGVGSLTDQAWWITAGPGNAITISSTNRTQIQSNNMAYFLIGEVSEVPLPQSIWLFGSALVGLIGLRKRSKAA